MFKPGNHGSTFGGNPLACRAALAVLDTLEGGKLGDRAAQLGSAHEGRIPAAHSPASPAWYEIRAKGLMIGIELDRACGELVKQRAGPGPA